LKLFGIIGRSLAYSQSKSWFETRFAELGMTDCRFENFELASLDRLDGLLERCGGELRGFSVTIPYKREIFSRLSFIDPGAREVGAVNCVKVSDGRLIGYNTDLYGFAVGLERLIGSARPSALILGTGGASMAVRRALENAGLEFRSVSRHSGPGLLTYSDLTPEIIDTHRLIINTTPLGTHPDVTSKPPIPYDLLTPAHHLYDLVYNPSVTSFLSEGRRRGAKTLNGETMLHAQAQRNLDIWTTS
jgi:shikimate dehydrogenase